MSPNGYFSLIGNWQFNTYSEQKRELFIVHSICIFVFTVRKWDGAVFMLLCETVPGVRWDGWCINVTWVNHDSWGVLGPKSEETTWAAPGNTPQTRHHTNTQFPVPPKHTSGSLCALQSIFSTCMFFSIFKYLWPKALFCAFHILRRDTQGATCVKVMRHLLLAVVFVDLWRLGSPLSSYFFALCG